MNTVDITIIREIFRRKEEFDLYILHEKYMLSPGQISNSIRKLLARGLVERAGGFSVRLTDEGRLWALKNRKYLFLRPRGREWLNSLAVGEAADAGQTLSPRLPSLRRLDKAFFVSLGKS